MEEEKTPIVEEELESTNEEVETPEETPTEEPQEEADAEEQETPEPEEPTAEAEPEEKPPSRRESLRIQQLLDKMRQPQQEFQQQFPQNGINYSEALDADPEVINRLEADRAAAASQSYQQGLDQAKSMQFHTRLDIDAPKVEAKYKILDKESSEFNPAVADAVNTWYLQMTGYDPQTDTVSNPNIRYSDFVEGYMELVDQTAGERVARTSQNIAKQAASTGLRPDGSETKRLKLDQAPENMTTEELEAVIKQSLPKN